ncbi:hypothetical protein QQZ08_001367 [Neonectria magnoliae]|uniref:Uncharacterized protein n=1 Tax=Neonectria magnoliae TaxID=2732573 RepID=A0ABR1IH08_9HYPO
MLELVTEARVEGRSVFASSSQREATYVEISEKLSTQWPAQVFGTVRLHHKLRALLRIWRAFLAIERSEPSYDADTGRIDGSDREWWSWERKYDAPASYLRWYGLRRRDLYESAFEGSDDVGITAVGAGDVDAINSIGNFESLSSNVSSDDDQEEALDQSQGGATGKRKPGSAGPSQRPPKRPMRAIEAPTRSILRETEALRATM